jgi:hypothetical protein
MAETIKLARDLRRGDRVTVGTLVGPRVVSLTSVRFLRNVEWVGGERSDAIELRWRVLGARVVQSVKPDASIPVEG